MAGDSKDTPPPYSETPNNGPRDAIDPSLIAQAAAAAIGASGESAVEDPPLQRTVSSSQRAVPTGASSAPKSEQKSASAHHHDELNVPFGGTWGKVQGDVHDGFGTNAQIGEDGRVNVRINQRSRRLSAILEPALRSQLNLSVSEPPPPPYIPEHLGGRPGERPPPPMNVVIHVVGSRGDVQPFVALGKVLKETYGHRVRLATHPVFGGFVKENGLEFFSIGGDPAELMSFMVRNPGLMPGFDSLRKGDVGKRRREIATMVRGCWRSCIESGDGTGLEATDDTVEDWMTDAGELSKSTIDPAAKPWVCDAIIANPPSFAHVHCAEKLGVPLHMMFTMPWSPTQAFPHPLVNMESTNADQTLTNFMSYAIVDMMTWQGLGDVINRFRQTSLHLEPISLMWAPGMLARLRIPYTYCWSPALIPKPRDWGGHIGISGFYFLNLASNYTPAPDLAEFLAAGPPPVYIGFGSIVVDDPNGMTKLIFDAVKKTGQRALVSKGWGGFGADQLGIPEGVFMLGNVPHDWLFQHVSCVVHHGGAGTTAAGIAAGKPTVVVPFFGDQPFWGAMVARAGAGPMPVHSKELTADKLAAAITEALKPTSQDRAKELSAKIKAEKGSDLGAQMFHQQLKVDELRCSLDPSRVGVWRLKRTNVRLSALAATVLANEGLLDFGDLKLFRAKEYETDTGPWDPITGGATAIMGTVGSMLMGVADFPVETLKALTNVPTRHGSAAENGAQTEGKKEEGASTSSSGRPSTEATSATSLLEPSTTNSGKTSPLASPTASSMDLSQQETAKDEAFKASTSTDPTSPRTTSPAPDHNARSTHRSMAEALHGHFSHSRSESKGKSPHRSPFRHHSPFGHHRSPSEAEPGNLQRTDSECKFDLETVLDTGKGMRRIVGAGLKSPLDFTLALAKGFHNAPKLYHDDTVREHDKITGFQSGLKAAGKGFGYGFYDGITGMVTQPVKGAQKEGAAGFLKGVGKGIGGLILKPGAAIWGLPGYTFMGVYAELQKHVGSSVQNYIIAARTAQGYDDWHKSTPAQREAIVHNWKELQKTLKKKKNLGEEQLEHVQTLIEEHKERQKRKKSSTLKIGRHESTGSVSTPDLQHIQHSMTFPLPHPRSEELQRTEEAEMEEAIRQSIAQTSRGNPEEDKLIEEAIRASMAELSNPAPEHETEEEALQRALKASIAEAKRNNDHSEAHEAYEEQLRLALERSITDHRRASINIAELSRHHGHTTDSEWDGSDTETPPADDDDRPTVSTREISNHPSSSQTQPLAPPEIPPRNPSRNSHRSPLPTPAAAPETTEEEDEQLKLALAQSHREHEEKLEKERTEEEVLMEHAKRRSTLEQQYRKQMEEMERMHLEELEAVRKARMKSGEGGNGKEGKGGEGERLGEVQDEELERAIKMSMEKEH